MIVMQIPNIMDRVFKKEVKCALCLAKVPRETTVLVHEKKICDWCVNYYSSNFPKDWKEKIRVMFFF